MRLYPIRPANWFTGLGWIEWREINPHSLDGLTMKHWFRFSVVLLFGVIALGNIRVLSAAETARRPNVILIITDDQGYGDLGCHGNPALKTPNLDRLHGESVRLTNF